MAKEISANIISPKHFNLITMAKVRKRICDVTGMNTSTGNFYMNQSHVKAVDNLRRSTGASKDQMQRMFNTLNTY